jgi:hypothetical protein
MFLIYLIGRRTINFRFRIRTGSTVLNRPGVARNSNISHAIPTSPLIAGEIITMQVALIALGPINVISCLDAITGPGTCTIAHT